MTTCVICQRDSGRAICDSCQDAMARAMALIAGAVVIGIAWGEAPDAAWQRVTTGLGVWCVSLFFVAEEGHRVTRSDGL